MPETLVIVPCGKRKIWDGDPSRGPVPARDTYTGAPFAVNRAYAERFSDVWLNLSAKYGLIAPEFVIPGPYDVTFKRRRTNPVPVDELRRQARSHRLDRYSQIVVLGGAEYRNAFTQATAGTPITVTFPTAGMPIGKAMHAIRYAIATCTPVRPANADPPALVAPMPV